MLAAYEIHELVAQSPESVVFAGEEKQGGAPIAMRRYLARRDGERRAEDPAAFAAEAAKSHGIEEAHVVGILAAGFDPQDHHPIFVTRTVDGDVLPKMLDGSLLAESDGLGVVDQALEGLEFLHTRGLVHGGLRPDRLVWSRTGGLWLIDAGVEPALIRLSDYAAAGEAATTAPELRAGGGRSIAGDFYALGACMFELLSGAPVPTDGRPRPGVGHGSLARWDQWLDAMCADDPAARPVDVTQAHALLTAALAIIPMRKVAPAKPAPLARAAGPIKTPQRILAPGQEAGPDLVVPNLATSPARRGPRQLATPAAPLVAPASPAGGGRQLATPAATVVQAASPAGSSWQLTTPAATHVKAPAAPVSTQRRFMTPRGAAIAAVLGIAAAIGVFLVTRPDPESSVKSPPTTQPAAAASVKTPDRPPAKPVVPSTRPTPLPAGQGNAPRYEVRKTPDMRLLAARPEGEPAYLVGTVKSVTLSRSGDFIDIAFSDVRARAFIKIDPAADPQAMIAQIQERFLNKNVNVFGTVENRPGEKVGVRFLKLTDITLEP